MAFNQIWNAGHGYNTPGKRSPDGMREYEFNRSVASYCKKITDEEYLDVNSIFTHSDSRDVPLKERTDYANRIAANCYTSIHANAYGTTWNDANGIETYVHPFRSTEDYALALQIQRELISATGLKDRGVRTADFHELRETKMTAILCELGFMTNRQEAALLRSDEYRRKVAAALVRAHARFFGWRKKPVVKGVSTQKEEQKVAERDINKVSSWAKKDWERAVLNGYFNDSRPGDTITREEAAVVTNRIIDNVREYIVGPLEERIKALENELTTLKKDQ